MKSFAARAAASFVGSTGSSLLAGDGLKKSLMNGVKTAGVTYATAPFVRAAFPTGGQYEGTYFDRVGQGFDPQGGLTVPGYTPKGEEVAQTSRDGQNLLTDADKKFFSDLDARQEFARKGGGDLAYAPQAEGISDVTPGSYQDPSLMLLLDHIRISLI